MTMKPPETELTTLTRAGLCEANGAQLHYELRGDTGAPLLMIVGASGDAGAFDAVADVLAQHFTVLLYDRRARSRSPRPRSWIRTSVNEQADDAAALLRALNLAPAHVFGTSSGASIGLNLVLRHPELVRSAVLHEPPKIGVLPDRDQLLADLRGRMETAQKKGGAAAAMSDFLGWISGPVPAHMTASALATRERVLAHAQVWLDYELGVIDRYDPPAESARMPVAIAIGTEGATALHKALLTPYRQALQQLATRVGATLQTMTGAHVPYRTHPREFVAELRTLLT